MNQVIEDQQLQETALLAYQEKSQELNRKELSYKHDLKIRSFVMRAIVITACGSVFFIVIFSLVSLLIWGNETKWQTVFDSLKDTLSYLWTAVGAGAIGAVFGKKLVK